MKELIVNMINDNQGTMSVKEMALVVGRTEKYVRKIVRKYIRESKTQGTFIERAYKAGFTKQRVIRLAENCGFKINKKTLHNRFSELKKIYA